MNKNIIVNPDVVFWLGVIIVIGVMLIVATLFAPPINFKIKVDDTSDETLNIIENTNTFEDELNSTHIEDRNYEKYINSKSR